MANGLLHQLLQHVTKFSKKGTVTFSFLAYCKNNGQNVFWWLEWYSDEDR